MDDAVLTVARTDCIPSAWAGSRSHGGIDGRDEDGSLAISSVVSDQDTPYFAFVPAFDDLLLRARPAKRSCTPDATGNPDDPGGRRSALSQHHEDTVRIRSPESEFNMSVPCLGQRGRKPAAPGTGLRGDQAASAAPAHGYCRIFEHQLERNSPARLLTSISVG